MATVERRRELRERYEAAADVPLLMLAVVFLFLVAAQIFDRHLSPDVRRTITYLYLGIWIVFVADYFVRLLLAADRKRFVRAHLVDLVILAFPFLRPFMLIRFGATFGKVGLQVRQIFTRHHLLPALGAATAITVFGAMLVLLVERGRDSKINSFGEALWWSVQTITTLGYGDLVPVTPAGRILGAMVMVSGVAVFGVVAANLAAFLNDLQARQEQAEAAEEESAEARLERKVDMLLVRLEAVERSLGPGTERDR